MKLSNQYEIEIPLEKVTGYVLSPTHKIGSLKAAYFRSHGFTAEKYFQFVAAIQRLVSKNEITTQVKKEYGVNFIVDGKIKTPKKKMINVRTVWIVEGKSKKARLVTVYPK